MVGVVLGGYVFVLVGEDGDTWGAVGTGAAAGAVGGGEIGAFTLCSHTIVSGEVRIGSVGTL